MVANSFNKQLHHEGFVQIEKVFVTPALVEELQANTSQEGFISQVNTGTYFDKKTIENLLTILKNPEEWDEEVDAFKHFVQQFEKLNSKEELTDSIVLQYDTRQSWISKFFPKVVATTELLGTSYFQGFDKQQYEKREDGVINSYDALVIKYNSFQSILEE